VARVLPALDRLEGQRRVVRGEFRPDGVEREWCDEGVLRQLRRRSLASLRQEVEPVEPEALGRFLPEWQGVGGTRGGVDALVEVLGSLQGAAVPASVLERDVLPSRLPSFQPTDLDALLAAGEVVWVGAGPIGRGDGRVRLAFRDQLGLVVVPPPEDERPDDPLHRALRDHLATRGASFWPELVAGAHEAGQTYDQAAVLDALWDLVWAGEVTNDVMAPLRAVVGTRGRRRGGGGRSAPARPRGRPLRPNLGSATRTAGRAAAPARGGPPTAAGRWSLVAPLLEPRPAPTEAAHALALQLLERYGVLTREAVLAEGVPGGFAAVYPVLKALEERGQVRRGYFVAGLGAAQFALPGAVDRLRARRDPSSGAPGGQEDPPAPVVLAATDPAQPYGAALAWPEAVGGRAARTAGAHVVLVDGELCAHLERGGHRLVTFAAASRHPRWAEGLAALVGGGRLPSLELTHVDGEPAAGTPWGSALRAVGFVEGYRGLTLRR
jgi:ATP-dependent Lhr-like helicase